MLRALLSCDRLRTALRAARPPIVDALRTRKWRARPPIVDPRDRLRTTLRAARPPIATAAALLLLAVTAPATAQRFDNDGRSFPAASRTALADAAGRAATTKIVGSRPAGCPRAYCGCGVSLKVFGKIRPELNLAANWLRKFPRTPPAPNMVAARRGHVMVLLAHVEGRRWRVYDPNSGGGKTRIHVRSIAGFTVVDPHGSSLARGS